MVSVLSQVRANFYYMPMTAGHWRLKLSMNIKVKVQLMFFTVLGGIFLWQLLWETTRSVPENINTIFFLRDSNSPCKTINENVYLSETLINMFNRID